MSKSSIDRKSQDEVEYFLKKARYEVRMRGDTNSSFDIVAEKDGKVYAINVKSGKKSFSVTKRDLERMLSLADNKNWIPALLFLMDFGLLLFSLEKFIWSYRGEAGIYLMDDTATHYKDEHTYRPWEGKPRLFDKETRTGLEVIKKRSHFLENMMEIITRHMGKENESSK